MTSATSVAEIPSSVAPERDAGRDAGRDAVARLVDAVYDRYGYDFRNYAYASLRRRIARAVAEEAVADTDALRRRLVSDHAAFERFVAVVSVHVTSMFRDPGFFAALRRDIVPVLRIWPLARIWVAGCSTGEELYSVAIVLEEEGLLDRVRLYATDLSHEAIARARSGVVPLSELRSHTDNYQRAGGSRDFSDYYTTDGRAAQLRPSLLRSAVFAQHSLVTDGAPNEFHLILCRNVMIYFDATLQARVLRLFDANLVPSGFLCLGRRESFSRTAVHNQYEALNAEEKIFRKVR